MTTLNFKDMGGPVYVGRANGEKAREHLNIDRLDTVPEPVEVIVPDSTYSINSSYFLGLFGKSVRAFGTIDGFLGHYNFKAKQNLMDSIRRHADRALREQGVISLE